MAWRGGGRGGARKSKAADAKDWVPRIREQWAQRCNQVLEWAGCSERVDHRSLAERAKEAYERGDAVRGMELSREPNVHLGPAAMASVERQIQGRAPMRKLEQTREVKQCNRERRSAWEGLEKEFQTLKRDLVELGRELLKVEQMIRQVAEQAQEWVRQT